MGIPGAKVVKPGRAPLSSDLPFLKKGVASAGSSCTSRSIGPGAGLGPQLTAPKASPGLREEAARVGSGLEGRGPGSTVLLLLSVPLVSGPLPLASPPKIGLMANHQPLTSFTVGDPWPIARGFFARSRQGQPIGAAPRPWRGAGQEWERVREGDVPGEQRNQSGPTSLRCGDTDWGRKKEVLGSGPWLPSLEAQRLGALANGSLAGHLRSE